MLSLEGEQNMSRWTSIAAILLALAVCAGAFGAHALKGRLDQYAKDIYEKAVFYQFVHALGILIVAGIQANTSTPIKYANLICAMFTVGTVLFSGSLYLLAISGIRWLGAVTPIGGVAFILAWVILAAASIRN